MFQYRKRYVRVATACLETRPQTGLKWQIGKPQGFFNHIAGYSRECHSLFSHEYACMPVLMHLPAFTEKVENLISNFPLL